jgi:hypothetical protein
LSVRRFPNWQRGGNMLPRKHDCFAAFLFAADQSYQQQANDAAEQESSHFLIHAWPGDTIKDESRWRNSHRHF